MSKSANILLKDYCIINLLGSGAFGEIYLVQSKANPEEKFAAKIQNASVSYPQLHFESKMLKYLNSIPSVGIPKINDFFVENGYNIMVIDLLGKSLQDLLIKRSKRLKQDVLTSQTQSSATKPSENIYTSTKSHSYPCFSLKTVMMLTLQMIDRVETLHQKRIIHRDIKPDNFLMGTEGREHILFIVDFGLSKKYIQGGKHIPYKDGKDLTGTLRYASINTHNGIEQSRRDDLESVSYVMIYLLNGILPWQGFKDNKNKQRLIKETKVNITPEQLAENHPFELAQFIRYTRGLSFEQKPDYDYLRKLLINVMVKYKLKIDNQYDWSSTKSRSRSQKYRSSLKSIKSRCSKHLMLIENKLESNIPKPEEKKIKIASKREYGHD